MTYKDKGSYESSPPCRNTVHPKAHVRVPRVPVSALFQYVQLFQCVAVYSGVFQHIQKRRCELHRVCCSVLYVAVCCSVLQCAAVCCSVLQCVAVCCSVLQCVAVCCSVLQCAAVCCSVLQCVAVCCCFLQCVSVCCSVCRCIPVHPKAQVQITQNQFTTKFSVSNGYRADF